MPNSHSIPSLATTLVSSTTSSMTIDASTVQCECTFAPTPYLSAKPKTVNNNVSPPTSQLRSTMSTTHRTSASRPLPLTCPPRSSTGVHAVMGSSWIALSNSLPSFLSTAYSKASPGWRLQSSLQRSSRLSTSRTQPTRCALSDQYSHVFIQSNKTNTEFPTTYNTKIISTFPGSHSHARPRHPQI